MDGEEDVDLRTLSQFGIDESRRIVLAQDHKHCYETEAYDALMDEYEPGAEAADIEELFSRLRHETVSLLEKIQNAPQKPDPSIEKFSAVYGL